LGPRRQASFGVDQEQVRRFIACALAAIPRALGARCFYVLLASLSRFFGMSRGVRPLGSFAGIPGSFGTRCLFYGFVASLRRLLRVLRTILAHYLLL
jgi:hypothetical protein